MSIAPPSDIILDVAQAADPQRLQAATTKLNAMATASGGDAVDFHALLASAAGKAPGTKGTAGSTLSPTPASRINPQMSPYRRFEAVLLQTFVQEMLPKDENLFGDAASADACRGMLAEQIANQLAKSGRIGIAQMIEKAHAPQAAVGTQLKAPAGSFGASTEAAAPAVGSAAVPAARQG